MALKYMFLSFPKYWLSYKLSEQAMMLHPAPWCYATGAGTTRTMSNHRCGHCPYPTQWLFKTMETHWDLGKKGVWCGIRWTEVEEEKFLIFAWRHLELNRSGCGFMANWICRHWVRRWNLSGRCACLSLFILLLYYNGEILRDGKEYCGL